MDKSFQIKPTCVCCGACAADCPVSCIRRQGQQYVIGLGCIGCGDCYTICPVGAVQVRVVSEEENTL